jgi:DNA ligase-1
MNFHELSLYLQKLEGTTSRNSIIEILAELYKETSKAEIGQVTYLLQGRVVPVYTDLEFGMADKMVIKAIAKAYDEPEEEIRGEYKKVGDLGILAEKKTAEHKGKDSISIDHVFKTLKKIAETSGEGSVEKKIDLLVGLFQSADSLSARYIARIPVGNLRLGFPSNISS